MFLFQETFLSLSLASNKTIYFCIDKLLSYRMLPWKMFQKRPKYFENGKFVFRNQCYDIASRGSKGEIALEENCV